MSFMKNKYVGTLGTTIGVVIVAALTIVALGAQQGPPPGRGPGGRGGQGGPGGRGMGPGGPGAGGPMIGMMIRQLNLTDAQKEQVKAVLEADKDATKAIATRMIAARQALGEAVTADTVDEALIRAKAAEVAAVEADGAVARAKVHAQVFALLTPEQQAKAKELRAAGKGRIGQFIGNMFGGRMGGRGMGRGPGRGMGGPGRGISGWF